MLDICIPFQSIRITNTYSAGFVVAYKNVSFKLLKKIYYSGCSNFVMALQNANSL